MSNKKLSVVIPTLQKNVDLLVNLLVTLEKDDVVDEIILIDNSLKGLEYSSAKLRIITPEENLFVNPSWNLGTKEAKNEIVALLNDDIIISDNLCSQVVAKMSQEMGCVGINSSQYVKVTNVIKENNDNTEIILQPEKYMDIFWGIAIFFYKSSYVEIPESLKIVHGDTWLFEKNKQLGRQNYFVNGQLIYHYGSLTHGLKIMNPICKKDRKLFDNMFYPWYKRIFYIEGRLNGIRMWLLGVKLILSFRKRKSLVNDMV